MSPDAPAQNKWKSIRWGYAHLTAILFLLILLRPVLDTTFVIQFFGLVLLTAAWAVTGALRRARWILIGLASITVGLILISYKWDETAGPRASLAVSFALVAACVVLLFYCVVMLLFSLLRSKQILLNDILGAVSLYLVFGYIWAFVYTSMELLHPGSFDGLELPITGTTDRLSATFSRLSYFSFITLATQGYGDVTPRTAWAETFVMLQTIVGQLYVALVLAYLLSVHLNSNRNAEQQ